MQLNRDRLSKHPSTVRRRWGEMLGRLVGETHFDWEELETLCFVFHKLTKGKKGRMSRREFIDIMHNALDMTNTDNVDYACRNFDPNNNMYISMEDWCKGMSVVLRGNLDEKIKYCFETYDRHREKCLRRKNLVWMVTDNWKATPETDCQEQVQELLETVMASVASDSERGITQRDYRRAVNKYPMLLQFLGEVLPARPAAATFLSAMLPRAPTYSYMPEYGTDRDRPVRAPHPAETVSRLGGIGQLTKTAKDRPRSFSLLSLTVDDL